jgi:beta-glucuronidase
MQSLLSYLKKLIAYTILCNTIFNFEISASNSTETLDEWQFCFAGEDSSLSFFEIQEPGKRWEKIKIPHSYNLNETFGKHMEGFAWYVKEIEIKLEEKYSYVLDFKGICLRGKIFVNGILIHDSKYAYLPFQIDITKFVNSSPRLKIAVQVDNRLLRSDFPDQNCNGWWIYGGLIREVILKKIPELHIEGINISTFYLNKQTSEVIIKFDAPRKKTDSIIIEIVDSTKNEVMKCSTKNCICTLKVSNIEFWDPENPILYTFIFTPFFEGKKGEISIIKRGFKQLTVNNGMIHLNGRKLFIRGVGRHDVRGQRGPLLTREERIDDLVAIKSSGANLLRIAHFPQHEDIYEICDSIGLIVMDEIPAWKTYPGFIGDSTGIQLASKYIEELLNAHGNYTCIGFWCIANEIQSVSDRVVMYIKNVAAITKKIDPSRLVTYTTYFYQFDKAYQYVDVISINEYFGWFVGSVDMLTSLIQMIKKEYPEKPILVTEFGAAAALGVRNQYANLAGPLKSIFTKDFSEDYQALFHKKQISTIWENREKCSGAVVWCYNDFMENRQMPNSKKLKTGLNGMGLVTEERQNKLAFGVVATEFMKIKREMEDTLKK